MSQTQTEYKYTKPRGPVAAMYTGPGPIYALPSLMGQKNHDPRSNYNRGPAYHFTLSRKLFTDEGENGTPAPLSVDSKLSRTGKESSPAYTMCGKWSSREEAREPGPSDYVCLDPCVQAGRTRSPAYSFGTSRSSKETLITPGPNQYSSSYNKDNPQESRLKRSPSYTITGRRSEIKDNDVTPGPGTYATPSREVYLKRSPAYTLSGRHGGTDDNEKSPGPLDYHTDRVWVHKKESPSYSFGLRHSPYRGSFLREINV